MANRDETRMAFGEKLKSARKRAGLTQEQLAEKLYVSRQAVAKWEADRGMPDIENLKRLSQRLNVSVDFLLDGEKDMDLSVMRAEINLDDYVYVRRMKGRWNRKAGKKDMAVRQKYPDAEIHGLLGRQTLSRRERIADNAIGRLTSAPFGIPEFLNGLRNADKEFYLVNQADGQFLVVVTDAFIESRLLAHRITDRKFSLGNFSFVDCGPIPEP